MNAVGTVAKRLLYVSFTLVKAKLWKWSSELQKVQIRGYAVQQKLITVPPPLR